MGVAVGLGDGIGLDSQAATSRTKASATGNVLSQGNLKFRIRMMPVPTGRFHSKGCSISRDHYVENRTGVQCRRHNAYHYTLKEAKKAVCQKGLGVRVKGRAEVAERLTRCVQGAVSHEDVWVQIPPSAPALALEDGIQSTIIMCL